MPRKVEEKGVDYKKRVMSYVMRYVKMERKGVYFVVKGYKWYVDKVI